MSIMDRIQSAAQSLTPSERRLIEAIVGAPQQAALGTALDLARGAEVHEATVSRLVRKLGFDSYSTFRSALQIEFIPTQETATRLEKSLGSADEHALLGALVAQEIAALARVESFVSMDMIHAVAAKLMAARRIHVFGRGNAEILALMMVKRFRRFGCDVQMLSGDLRDLAEQALGFGEGDVVLGFAFRRPPRGYAALIESAREAGASTIVVAGLSGAMLTPAPDILLSARAPGRRRFSNPDSAHDCLQRHRARRRRA
ncbi:MAG: MurR/RpiR family transcriptional regulator [Phyllobacteriaceae bacterium]|nr:MurR/RpiR family transcriptional regulator [Phyllobacteriaceae bacterium]